MEGDQLNLFPEDDYKIMYKSIDYAYVDELPYDPYRENYNQYSILPKQTYRIYKTGGYNRYRKDDGPIYPFVQNIKTGKIISVTSKITDGYPSVTFNVPGDNNKKRIILVAKMHRIAALAFIENKNNLPAVDHINKNILDYKIENLRWYSLSDNNKGAKNQKKNVEWQRKLEKNGRIE